jgi:hypothetical protein
MLSQFGMGSVMYNYYRKTNDEDEDLPKVGHPCLSPLSSRLTVYVAYIVFSAKSWSNDYLAT